MEQGCTGKNPDFEKMMQSLCEFNTQHQKKQKQNKTSQALVAHTCNPSYMGG
jgi:hypothetical protein